MVDLLLGFAVSAGLALVLTPVVRKLAIRWGLLDHPDGARKMHARATPVAGGLAILTAMLAALGLVFAFSAELRPYLLKDSNALLGWCLAATLICALGVFDDFGHLRGRFKLLGQGLIALLVVGMGVRVDRFHLFGFPVELGWLAIPFTVFWLLGAINSLNLLDGMDGFLSSIGIICTLGFASMACLNGSWTAACVALILAGALLGFLRYNFPPATIFLGDSGSMLIGLTIGMLAIQSSLKASAAISLAAPLAIMTLPILDTFAAIVRRKLTGKSIYATDRGHLHHCMASRGLSNRHVLASVAGLCSLTVLGALGSLYLANEYLALLSVATVTCILIATRLFGYVELQLIKKSLAHRTNRFLGFGKSKPQTLELQLQGKVNWRRLWSRLESAGQDLRLQKLTLDVNAAAFHEAYHARWENSSPAHSEQNAGWSVAVPISLRGKIVGRLEVAGERQDEQFWDNLAKVSLLVEDFEQQLAASLPPPLPPMAAKVPELAVGVN